MLAEGADVIEIGGESTGPNSPDVPVEEELRRTIPVIREVKRMHPRAVIAIDTYKSRVALEAIAAGATMVNDVTAGRSDREMFQALAAASDVSLVLMYAKDRTPRTLIAERNYNDVVAEIATFLRERRNAAVAAGVPQESIILDPGLGHFVSSDAHYSFTILARLEEFTPLQCPILVSPSRKSFLAGPENLKVADRLPGTIAASAIAVLHGARYVRTHDIAAVRRGCEVAMEMLKQSPR